MAATVKPLRLRRGTKKTSLDPFVILCDNDRQIWTPKQVLSVLVNFGQWRRLVNLND